jgi:hypothetical protein
MFAIFIVVQFYRSKKKLGCLSNYEAVKHFVFSIRASIRKITKLARKLF